MRPWREASASDPRLAARPRYALDRCDRCGTSTVAAEQRGLERTELYTDGTYRTESRLEGAIELLRRLIDRDRLRAIGRLPADAEILEIGAGDGRLLASLSCPGRRLAGVEPAAPYAARARARGLDVEAIAIEQLVREPASCDAIVLWHVLEHLDDPADAVRRARGWLRPGGRLIVAVPNRASWQARIAGDRWFHQDVPRHLTHFTADGLEALLVRNGFHVAGTTHLLLEHNPLGMWLSLLNRLTRERDVAFRLLKRTMPLRGAAHLRDVAITVLLGPLLVPVAAALEGLAGLARHGGTIVVRAS